MREDPSSPLLGFARVLGQEQVSGSLPISMESGPVGTTDPWKRAGKFSQPRGAGGFTLLVTRPKGRWRQQGAAGMCCPQGPTWGRPRPLRHRDKRSLDGLGGWF